MKKKPLIAVTSNSHRLFNGQMVFQEYSRYLKIVEEKIDAASVLLPVFGNDMKTDTYIEKFDGVLFTGSVSNVHPKYYDEESYEGNILDETRDITNFHLLSKLLQSNIPLLFICRGIQELNVHLGGSLHQKIWEVDGKSDHRRVTNIPYDISCHPSHDITIKDGGLFAKKCDITKKYKVNSLHGQAISKKADSLFVEAVSNDDVIEAASLPSRHGYTCAVQWHPEFNAVKHDFINQVIWDSFYEAVYS